MDSIQLSKCTVDTHLKVTSNSGLYLEGLSILANVTNNTELIDECVLAKFTLSCTDRFSRSDQLAWNAMTSPAWTQATGVITEGCYP